MSRRTNIRKKVKQMKKLKKQMRDAASMAGDCIGGQSQRGKVMIGSQVKRFWADTYFGAYDRCVPVVLARWADAPNLRERSVPLEEYIAEQLDFHVAGDLLILNNDGGLSYDGDCGLGVPDNFDRRSERQPDGIPVYSYKGFLAWTDGGSDEILQTFRMSDSVHPLTAGTTGSKPAELMSYRNDGPRLVESNYWDSEQARNGLFQVSINDGAFRLLVPRAQENDIREIRTGRHALVTYGFHCQVIRPMYEIMFEDDTNSPFALWLSLGQFDRAFGIEDAASKPRKLIVYTKGCIEVARMPVFFRQTDRLPYLKPWQGRTN